jgi:hypothetical protein
MLPSRSRWIALALLALLDGDARAGGPVAPEGSSAPDPASVRRFGSGYRYSQDGWIVLHIEGSPYERGYQHGRLMAREIGELSKTMAAYRNGKAPSEGWRELRLLADALFLRRFEPEYLEEMKGIADGCASAGVKIHGQAPDLLDIVAINSEIEITFLDEALAAWSHGLEGRRFEEPADAAARPAPPREEHCSAFAATGPATADGHVVIGHITMWNLPHAMHFNVWIDIKPEKGHRVLMQTYPGGIQSGMDYYMNDHGLIVCETTLGQTRFHDEGRPLCGRIRRVLQYADSIDDAVAILKAGNNGLYTNEWLLADAGTDEIAMFELGTHKSRLWRSSRNEWFGGTEGFYWGCNNAKDLQVRLEAQPGVEGRPANVVWHPADRDRKWVELYAKHRGKIGLEFGMEAFTTPPLSASHSLDAKVTTAALARELTTYAKFGPPLGRVWEPTFDEQKRYPETIRPLVPQDWTILKPAVPGAGQPGADLAATVPEGPAPPELPRTPAWSGTLLPAGDADIWLAAAFADYERIVAREGTGERAKERRELGLFGPLSRYLAASMRLGHDVALNAIAPAVDRDEWYDIAAGKGVLILDALRDAMGDEAFRRFMDGFGRAHAGQPVTSAAFFDAAEAAHEAPLPAFRAAVGTDARAWRSESVRQRLASGRFWSIGSFEHDPEQARIVYGTRRDREANREAALRFQREFARKWANVMIPVLADSELSDRDRASHHLILIGRPETNAVAAGLLERIQAAVRFQSGSFVIGETTYGHEGSAVVMAGPNPDHPARSIVLVAGLGAASTWKAAVALAGRDTPACEVLLLPNAARPRPLVPGPPSEPAVAAGSSPPAGHARED